MTGTAPPVITKAPNQDSSTSVETLYTSQAMTTTTQPTDTWATSSGYDTVSLIGSSATPQGSIIEGEATSRASQTSQISQSIATSASPRKSGFQASTPMQVSTEAAPAQVSGTSHQRILSSGSTGGGVVASATGSLVGADTGTGNGTWTFSKSGWTIAPKASSTAVSMTLAGNSQGPTRFTAEGTPVTATHDNPQSHTSKSITQAHNSGQSQTNSQPVTSSTSTAVSSNKPTSFAGAAGTQNQIPG